MVSSSTLFSVSRIGQIVVSSSPGERRAAVLRDGEVWGLAWEWPDQPNPVGAVYSVRVTRLAPEARGAFVAVDAAGQQGFLDLSGAKPPPLHEGQTLLAQVTRAAAEGKRLTFSPAVRLAGRYLVYTPMRPGISASRQLRDRTAVQRLQGVIKSAAEPGEGIILRAAAAALAAPDALLAELGRHRHVWQAAQSGDVLGEVVPAPSMVASLLIDRPGSGPLAIIVDAPALQAEARAAAAKWAPEEAITMMLDRADPFTACGGTEAMEAALGRQVPLATGGALWLEQTRACWTADVDSGGTGRNRPR